MGLQARKGSEQISPLAGLCSGPWPCRCTHVAAHTHSFSNTDQTNHLLCAETETGAPAQSIITRPVEHSLARMANYLRHLQQVQLVLILPTLLIMAIDWLAYPCCTPVSLWSLRCVSADTSAPGTGRHRCKPRQTKTRLHRQQWHLWRQPRASGAPASPADRSQ